jgi:hypothetical protein
MADPAFSYESDIAPQKGSYFSDVPRSGSGSPYSAINILRSASQKATKRVEDEELKRRNEELVYQRNRFILQEGKDAAKLEADRLAMEPEVTRRLEEINAMSDPVAKQNALTSFTINNRDALQNSSIKFSVDLINKSVDDSRKEQKETKAASDTSLYNQVIMYAEFNPDKAAEAALKISDPAVQAQAVALVASTAQRSRLSQEFNKEKEEKAAKEEQASTLKTNLQKTNEELLKITKDPVVGKFGKDGKPLLEYSSDSLNKIRVQGIKLGLTPEEVDNQLAADPDGFKRKLEELTTVPFTSSGGGGRVGGVTEGMLPSSP